MESSALRILDANLNRANEGLRVVEEYARFIANDAVVTRTLKVLRHQLRTATDGLRAALPCGQRLEASRDTAADVGTSIQTDAESSRESTEDVARASLKRLQEALRVLEEYGKLVSAEAGHAFEQMRYATYTLESEWLCGTNRRTRLQQARLYVLVTESLASADAVTVTKEAVAGGADIIQMREKEMEDGAFYSRALALNAICREAGVLFLINDRPHIARLADADGIHTGQGDLPIPLCRRILGPGRIVGKSTSAPDVLQAAADEGADYAGVGPVYETQTKQHRAAVGLDYVRHAAQHATIPYFCIGSINRETLPVVLDAGAYAVAVCTAIINAKDIAAETAWFKEQICAARS